MLTALYEGSDLFVLAGPRQDDTSVIVTFSHAENVEREHRPFAVNLADRSWCTTIFIVGRRNHWWQTSEIELAVGVINNFLRGVASPRIGYGISMGAYGALLHGARLDLSRILAVSPQTTIARLDMPLQAHLRAMTQRLTILDDRAAERAFDVPKIDLMFDPRSLIDRAHGDLLKQHEGLRRYILPFAGHQGLSFLQEIGCLSLVEQILQGACSPSHFRYEVRKHREQSMRYRSSLTRARELRSRRR